MESLKLKIGDDYPFNEEKANKSQCVKKYFSNLRNQTMQIPIHTVDEKINETTPKGPPEKRPKIQVPDKSEWSPLKLPGIPDLGDKNMKFPVKSVKEKITKLFPGESLDSFTALQKLEDDSDYEDLDYEEDSEDEDTKDIFGPDLRNQIRQIPDKPDTDEVLEMFHVELWGARTFKDELELIRRKFRKCRVGM